MAISKQPGTNTKPYDMRVTMSLLSSFLSVMAIWGGHHANMASAERVVISSSKAALTEYWRTMLPNSRMPLAILELRDTSAGYVGQMGKEDITDIHTPNKGNREKYVGASLLKATKIDARKLARGNQLLVWGWKNWVPHKKEDDKTARHLARGNQVFVWGWKNWVPHKKEDDKTARHLARGNQLLVWGWKNWVPHKKEDDKTARHLARGNQFFWSWKNWVPHKKEDDKTARHLARGNQLLVWGWKDGVPHKKEDDKTARHLARGNQLLVWGWARPVNNDGVRDSNVQEDDGHEGKSHGEDESTASNIIFHEVALTPGSTITPYIQPSATSHAPLLQRDIADTIPMSTRNFTDILEMFAPASHAMADDILMMLDLCENPHPIKGEKKTCATSLESMVEFAASVLTRGDTRDLRAFSSPDVPAEGVMSGRKYNVIAARKATESSETMTCHGMNFPFRVYMCHAVNPTRTYEVTLESEDLTSRMVVLAVCHLDTSEFDPAKMPGHAKPGEAPACHFIARDSILWAPVAPAAAAAA